MAAGLSKTRNQKLAWLQSLDSTVETRAKENIQKVNKTLPFQLKNFNSKSDATSWLIGE